VYNIIIVLVQSGFNPEDVPYHSLTTMATNITDQIMPDATIHKVSLHEGGMTPVFSHVSCY
jgi:hypothetical protein